MNGSHHRAETEADGTATAGNRSPASSSSPASASPDSDGPCSSPSPDAAACEACEMHDDHSGEGSRHAVATIDGGDGSSEASSPGGDVEASDDVGDSSTVMSAGSGPAGPKSAENCGADRTDAKERPGDNDRGGDGGGTAVGAVHVSDPAPNLIRSAFRGRRDRSAARQERAASRRLRQQREGQRLGAVDETSVPGSSSRGGGRSASAAEESSGEIRESQARSQAIREHQATTRGCENESEAGLRDSDASLTGISISSAELHRRDDFDTSFGSRSSNFSVTNIREHFNSSSSNNNRRQAPSRRDLFARSRSSAAHLGQGSLSTLSRSGRNSRNLLGMRRSVRNLNVEHADVHAAGHHALSSGGDEEGGRLVLSATLVDEEDVVVAQVVEEEAESEVERIVQRLERRNERRIPVTAAVKARFLRLCRDAQLKSSSTVRSGAYPNTSGGVGGAKWDSSCIRREDVLRIRKAVRLEVEGRTRTRRVLDGILAWLGFHCQCKVLLSVLNRAVDVIDRRRGGSATKSRVNLNASATSSGGNRTSFVSLASSVTSSGRDRNSFANLASLDSMERGEVGRRGASPQSNAEDANDDDVGGGLGATADDEADLFHFNDFTFYNLEQVSRYPWMRSAGVFSVLATLAFYLFSPILWCAVMNDPNVCPRNEDGPSGWTASLYFASATMSVSFYLISLC